MNYRDKGVVMRVDGVFYCVNGVLYPVEGVHNHVDGVIYRTNEVPGMLHLSIYPASRVIHSAEGVIHCIGPINCPR